MPFPPALEGNRRGKGKWVACMLAAVLFRNILLAFTADIVEHFLEST